MHFLMWFTLSAISDLVMVNRGVDFVTINWTKSDLMEKIRITASKLGDIDRHYWTENSEITNDYKITNLPVNSKFKIIIALCVPGVLSESQVCFSSKPIVASTFPIGMLFSYNLASKFDPLCITCY